MKKLLRSKALQIPILSILVMVLLISLSAGNSFLFRSSVVSMPQHAPFDGTVYPIKTTANWVKFSSEDYSKSFDQLDNSKLQTIPYYDPANLSKSVDKLAWGNPADDQVRNAKITYSVPYLGNYELDGVENAGSHPAVDIKTPMNTPVYAIANGVVVTAVTQSTGFGNHIVIKHENVPLLSNPNGKTTLYSSYNHLNSISVSEGSVVKKGDLIGKSGTSGTSTTPHLHFQIDTADAPYHPYWPFTFKEAQDAGLDFFSAINEGLGADIAAKLTVNPIVYVQKNMNSNSASTVNTAKVDNSDYNVGSSFGGSYASNLPSDVSSEAFGSNKKVENSEPAKVESNEDVDVYENVVKPELVANTNEIESTDTTVVEENVVIPEPVSVDPILNFSFDVEDSYLYEGKSFSFDISMTDQFGEKFRDGFLDYVVVGTENNVVRVNNAILTYNLFKNSKSVTRTFEASKSGKDRFKIVYGDEVYVSDWFDVVKVDKESRFKDVPTDSKYYEAIEYLVDNGVVNGYADKTFLPNQTVSRVEALKFILEGIDATLNSGSLDFTDLDKDTWYKDYLYTAFTKNVVKGYDDGTFKPNNIVSKAEFYKMLFVGMDADMTYSVGSSPFKDVKSSDWFYDYFMKAFELNIIDHEEDYARPSNGMTRGEVAYSIYKLMTLND